VDVKVCLKEVHELVLNKVNVNEYYHPRLLGLPTGGVPKAKCVYLN
jgi:hypothetical protein